MKLGPRYPLQFLVALLAAFLLWYALAAQRTEEVSVRGVRAQLILVNIPRNLVLTSSVPDSIAVQLRGPLTRALDPRTPVEVLLDLSAAQPGVNAYPINAQDVPLPPEVEVVSIEPPAISLELERRLTRSVPVRAVVFGVPAPGFVIGAVRVVPAQITVQGPESRLADLDAVDTTPLSVEGATEDVSGQVQALLPDPLLRSLTVVPLEFVVELLPEPTPTPTPTPQPARRRGG